MTSDAKIGLLLGLVFIFVIAFIINGLPSLRPQSSKAEVTPNMVTDENFGVAGREQRAQETITLNELLDRRTTGEPSNDTEAVVKDLRPDVEPSIATPGEAGETGEVRNVLPLPGPDTLNRITRTIEDVVKGLTEVAKPATVQEEKTTEPAPTIEAPKPQPKPTHVADMLTPRSAGVPISIGRTCVVADGETLASVAKRMYGPEEGNRIVNIQRIYEANRNVLKSPNEVRAGQELVIPPLDKSRPAQPRPDTVLPRTLFERVEAIGKGQVAAVEKTEPPKNEAGARWYVVQDGDNLWRIASTQLGGGARYQEIVKLNADLLKGKEVLDIGMKLRLPAK